MSDDPKTRCFVIMPFSKTDSHPEAYWTAHFEKFLKPLIEEVENVEVSRSQAARRGITPEIIMNLIESDLVVADITDHNPNVLWELGVRHSFKPGTITIAEEGTRIPFDIKDKGVLFYDTGHLNEEFKELLIKSVRDCCNNPDEADSPILEAISGRGTLYHLINKENILKKIYGLMDELHTNEITALQLIEDIKSGTELSELYSIEFTTPCLDNLFVERYLDEYEIDRSDYPEHQQLSEGSLDIYFVLWNLHRLIGAIRLTLKQHDLYPRDYILERIEAFKNHSEQIGKDLELIEELIEKTR